MVSELGRGVGAGLRHDVEVRIKFGQGAFKRGQAAEHCGHFRRDREPVPGNPVHRSRNDHVGATSRRRPPPGSDQAENISGNHAAMSVISPGKASAIPPVKRNLMNIRPADITMARSRSPRRAS